MACFYMTPCWLYLYKTNDTPLQKGSLEGTVCSVLWDIIKCGQNIGGLDDYQLCLDVLGLVGIKI